MVISDATYSLAGHRASGSKKPALFLAGNKGIGMEMPPRLGARSMEPQPREGKGKASKGSRRTPDSSPSAEDLQGPGFQHAGWVKGVVRAGPHKPTPGQSVTLASHLSRGGMWDGQCLKIRFLTPSIESTSYG